MAQPTLNTGWLNPSSNPINDGCTDPFKAYASDNSRVQVPDGSGYFTLAGFAITPAVIPPGAVILGIEVSVEMSSNVEGRAVGLFINVSGNAGSSFSTTNATARSTSNTDAYKSTGGSSSLWGKSWTPGNFYNDNFQVKVACDGSYSIETDSVDHVRVRVYFQPPISGSII